jgi:hypothetical protein
MGFIMGTTLMTQRRLDPWVSVAIDANALDRDGSDHDKVVDRLLELGAALSSVPRGVRIETQHPHAPPQISESGGQNLQASISSPRMCRISARPQITERKSHAGAMVGEWLELAISGPSH